MGIFFDLPGLGQGGGADPLRGLSGGSPGIGFASPQIKTQPVQAPKVAQAASSPAGGGVMSIIEGAAAKYGVPADWMRRSAQIESNFNPTLVSPSGAKGLFQFTTSTAKTFGLSNPFDPAANADAAARLYIQNRKNLQGRLGREPTGGEVYLAHQQGLSGAAALLAKPSENVVDALATAYKGDRKAAARAVTLNGGRTDMTAGQFASRWTSKFDPSRMDAGNDFRNSMAAQTPADMAADWAKGKVSTLPAPPEESASVAPGSKAPGLGIRRGREIGDAIARLGQPAGGGQSARVEAPPQQRVTVANIAPSLEEQLAQLNAGEPGRYIAMPVSQVELWQNDA